MPILNSLYAYLLAIAAYGTIDFKNFNLLHVNEAGYSFYCDETDNSIIKLTIDNHLEAYTRTQFAQHEEFIDPFVIGVQSADGTMIAGINGLIVSGTLDGAAIETYCYLQSLWVDEAYRHQGLGTLLVQKLQDYAQHQNCKMIKIECLEVDQSKPFFEKMGFDCTVTIPYPRNVHWMKKMLDNVDVEEQSSTIHLADHGYSVYMGFPLFIDIGDLCTFSQARKYLTNSVINFMWSDEAKKYADVINQKVRNYAASQGASQNESSFTIFITSPDHKIVGGAIGTIEYIPGYGKWCHICDVAIDADYRKQQLGRELFKYVDEYAQSKDCKHAELWTGQWQARGFYQKVGFNVITTIPASEHPWNQEGYTLRKLL